MVHKAHREMLLLLVDAHDALAHIVDSDEWASLSEGSSAEEVLKEIREQLNLDNRNHDIINS